MQRRSLLKLLSLTALQHLSTPDRPALALLRASSPETSPSAPLIALNQVGYLPHQPKFATLTTPTPDTTFTVRSAATSAVVLRGTLSTPQHDAASGDTVRLADLSALTTPGHYFVESASLRSAPFAIASDVYAEPLRLAMRAFYGQRCGCEVDLGGGYKHPACHSLGEFHASSGKSGRVPNAGGWHDAGDYGRYVVNSGITCGTLLWAWEMFPSSLRTLDLGIPRSHPHLPDYLTEILWNLNWMLSLQDSDGGVFHKQTSERFCAFILPERDTLPSEIIGTGRAPFKSTGATADLAAVMAIASRCYAPYDHDLSLRFLASARRAFDWAEAHPDVVFRNPAGISTGEYGDKDLSDELLWASAELWRTTGERRYEDAFLKGSATGLRDLNLQAPSWATVASLAYWTYALAPRPKHDDVAASIRRATLDAASLLIARSAQNGYGNTLANVDYNWGSNGSAANQSLLLAIADRLQPDSRAVTAALNNLHYLLGRNCHGVSWVTHVGSHAFQHPHHRPSAADSIAEPWPGMLSGGPNAHPADSVAETLPVLPPMRMWIDDERAYSLNEIAINWNAPLVFLLAFADVLGRPAK